MYTDILANLIITKIISVTTIFTEASTRLKRMPRSRWAIIQKLEGETEYYMNGKVYVSNKTHMVILPKGSLYEWVCTKSGHYSIIEFECETEHSDIMSFEISESLSDRILRTIREMEYKRTLKGPLCEMECIRDTYDIILRLAEALPKSYRPSSRYSRIQPAVDYIAKNCEKSVTNDALAEMCGISTVYFRKLFTESLGMSPINYIHSVRIKKAKEMLSVDGSNITSIATSLGYTSIYDFSRTFKKHVGVSPKKFAAANEIFTS